MAKIYEDKNVKVFLMSVEKNGEKIDFDVRKIKVNVTRIVKAPIESSKFPIVKLNRLLDEEIAKYAQNSKNEINSKKVINQADTYLTRSKRHILSKDTGQPMPLTASIVESSKFPIVKLNRLLDEEIAKYARNSKEVINSKKGINHADTYLTRSERQKLSKEMSQPLTEITLNANTNQTGVSMVHSSKRKNDIEATYMTRSKKAKFSKEMSQPMTEITPANIVDKKPKVEVSLPANNIFAKFQYSINEIVWTKIRGYPHWPAKVMGIERGKVSIRYEVLWLNDYRKSKVYESEMFTFYPNFEKFSAKLSTTIGLETAAKEALIYLAKMQK